MNLEANVIGAILKDPKNLQKIQKYIHSRYVFKDPTNRFLYGCIEDLDSSGHAIDMMSLNKVISEQHGGIVPFEFLAKLKQEVQNVENIESHASILKLHYMKSRAKGYARELAELAERDFDTLNDFLMKEQAILNKVYDIKDKEAKTLAQSIDNLTNNILYNNPILRYHLDYLDDFAGGATRGEMTALGGRPSHGKTTLMMNIIKAQIEAGRKVNLINREMSNESALTKIYILESDLLTVNHFRTEKLSEKALNEIERLKPIIKKKYENLIMYDNIHNLSDAIIEIKNNKPDIFFDDYVQMIDLDDKNIEGRFVIKKITRTYKWLAKETNSVAFILSQLNREMEKRIEPHPMLGDFSEGATIEHDSESCLALFYPYIMNSIDNQQKLNELCVLKARYGVVGTYQLGFNGRKCRFFNKVSEVID